MQPRHPSDPRTAGGDRNGARPAHPVPHPLPPQVGTPLGGGPSPATEFELRFSDFAIARVNEFFRVFTVGSSPVALSSRSKVRLSRGRPELAVRGCRGLLQAHMPLPPGMRA